MVSLMRWRYFSWRRAILVRMEAQARSGGMITAYPLSAVAKQPLTDDALPVAPHPVSASSE